MQQSDHCDQVKILKYPSLIIDKPYLGLQWLIRLRWFAVTGQLLTCMIASRLFHFKLPVVVLTACFLMTLGTNIPLNLFQTCLPCSKKFLVPLILTLDTCILTIMLYWTGGVHNPFYLFYLLHISMAAILLPQIGSVLGVILCSCCYALLFLSQHKLIIDSTVVIGLRNFNPYWLGTFVSMLLVGACVAFFVRQISDALAKAELELGRARILRERHERFASLATLATGMAHELATPLGTIAVACKELEHDATTSCDALAIRKDARLIRSEVNRCQNILQQLAQHASRGVDDMPASWTIDQIPHFLRDYLDQSLLDRVDYILPKTSLEVIFPKNASLQSLAIVLKNALDASLPDQRVTLEISENSHGITLAVKDYGSGMSQDVMARAGEPFFTTKEQGAGTGLGLFLVRMFLERVNGRWEIESGVGTGSKCILFIPNQNFNEPV